MVTPKMEVVYRFSNSNGHYYAVNGAPVRVNSLTIVCLVATCHGAWAGESQGRVGDGCKHTTAVADYIEEHGPPPKLPDELPAVASIEMANGSVITFAGGDPDPLHGSTVEDVPEGL